MSEKIYPSINILTISDTRDLTTDLSGQTIEKMVKSDHLVVKNRVIVKDELNEIRSAYEKLADSDILITNGGTGIAKRDVTWEAMEMFAITEIPGFGEFFRQLSYQEIGTHAMASRAFAFFDQKNQLIFCLPGSTNACELAVSKLILPEIYHLIKERKK